MTQDEKLALDRAILEGLFGWQDLKKLGQQWLWWGLPPNPKRTGEYAHAWGGFAENPATVVPLAEALRARGWCVGMQMVPGGWEVTLDGPTIGERSRLVQAEGSHLELALARAAARAVEAAAQTSVL